MSQAPDHFRSLRQGFESQIRLFSFFLCTITFVSLCCKGKCNTLIMNNNNTFNEASFFSPVDTLLIIMFITYIAQTCTFNCTIFPYIIKMIYKHHICIIWLEDQQWSVFSSKKHLAWVNVKLTVIVFCHLWCYRH